MSWPLQAVAGPFAARHAHIGGGLFCATMAPRYSGAQSAMQMS